MSAKVYACCVHCITAHDMHLTRCPWCIERQQGGPNADRTDHCPNHPWIATTPSSPCAMCTETIHDASALVERVAREVHRIKFPSHADCRPGKTELRSAELHIRALATVLLERDS